MSLTEIAAPPRAPEDTAVAEEPPAPTRRAAVLPMTCGCGCGFPITPGMRVYVINQVPYTLGCVGSPVPVTDQGPDLTPRPARRYTGT